MDIFFILKRYNSAVHLKPSPSTSLLTANQVEKPAIFDTMTGISFQSVVFSSFHCLVTDVKMLGNAFYHSDHLIVLDIVVFIITAIPRFETIGLIEIM